jgi:hypothetical protein
MRLRFSRRGRRLVAVAAVAASVVASACYFVNRPVRLHTLFVPPEPFGMAHYSAPGTEGGMVAIARQTFQNSNILFFRDDGDPMSIGVPVAEGYSDHPIRGLSAQGGFLALFDSTPLSVGRYTEVNVNNGGLDPANDTFDYPAPVWEFGTTEYHVTEACDLSADEDGPNVYASVRYEARRGMRVLRRGAAIVRGSLALPSGKSKYQRWYRTQPAQKNLGSVEVLGIQERSADGTYWPDACIPIDYSQHDNLLLAGDLDTGRLSVYGPTLNSISTIDTNRYNFPTAVHGIHDLEAEGAHVMVSVVQFWGETNVYFYQTYRIADGEHVDTTFCDTGSMCYPVTAMAFAPIETGEPPYEGALLYTVSYPNPELIGSSGMSFAYKMCSEAGECGDSTIVP